jgi:dCMP deaminase
MAKKTEFKKGQYYAAKYNGDNGDLIIGRIKSVRTCAEVILVNLLTGNTSTKKTSVLTVRNKRVSKANADKLVALFKKTGDKAAVRRMAVELPSFASRGHKVAVAPNIIPAGPQLHIPRLPWPQFFMLHAHLAATRSTCDRGPELLLDPGRRGVGAVIVKDHRVIAGGYNGSPPGQPHCNELTCECGFKYPSPSVPTKLAKDLEIIPDKNMKVKCPLCKEPLVGGHLIRDGHCVRTIHSEMNALVQCALDGTSPEGASIFCTASPCWDCAKALIRAKIKCVYVSQAYDSRYGLSGDVSEMLRSAGVTTEFIQLKFINNVLQGTRYIEEA